MGMSCAPMASCKSPKLLASCVKPPSALAAASADPPYCRLSSSKMSVCASASLPVSAIDLMTAFCSSLNWMPDRDSALRLATGSLSALPNWIDAPFRSPSKRVARSSAACCVRANCSPLMLVNVSSCAVASFRMVSSPNSVLLCRSLAMACSCLDVNPAWLPVDLRPASTCAMALACTWKARTDVAPMIASGAVRPMDSDLPSALVFLPKLLSLRCALPSSSSSFLVLAPMPTTRSPNFICSPFAAR